MSEALMNGYDSALPSGFTEVIFADIVTTAPDPFADIVTTAPNPFADIVTTAPDPFADIVTTAPDPFADIVTIDMLPEEDKQVSDAALMLALLSGAIVGGIVSYVFLDPRK